MTKGEFKAAQEEQEQTGRIVVRMNEDDDTTDEVSSLCNLMADVSPLGRELGYVDIITKKRNGNEWEQVEHSARVLKTERDETGWEFEIRLVTTH